MYVNYAGHGFITDKVTKPVQQNKDWSYLGGNDGALSLTFSQANGMYKGSYTFWYDYWKAYDATTEIWTSPTHTSKKVSFEGVFVPTYKYLRGFFLWEDTSFYTDPKTGKEKSYKYKKSCPVLLESL